MIGRLAVPALAQPIHPPSPPDEQRGSTNHATYGSRHAERQHPRTEQDHQAESGTSFPAGRTQKAKGSEDRVSPPPPKTLMRSRFVEPQAGVKGRKEGPGKAASGSRVAKARRNKEEKAKGWTP